jgi:D-3-phosphoglycerate dehydrogenase
MSPNRREDERRILMKVFVATVLMTSAEAEEITALSHDGHEVIVGEVGRAYSESELIELVRDADVIVAGSRDRISRKLLESAERLRVVVAPFVGVDHIDVDAATELGVPVVNSPAREHIVGVAEATIGLMLALFKRVKRNEARLRGGGWREVEDQGGLFSGKTVGIVGLGRIGSQVARRLAAWEVTLLSNDPYISPDYASGLNAPLTDLQTLLKASDIVTLHVVLTDETRNLIGGREFRMMKPTAYLINTARGGVVTESALAQAIREGRIAGAALDVFETEPLPANSPLRTLDPDRFILTPHNIGLSEAGRRANWALAVRSIRQTLRGEAPEPIKNPEAVTAWQGRLKRLGAS